MATDQRRRPDCHTTKNLNISIRPTLKLALFVGARGAVRWCAAELMPKTAWQDRMRSECSTSRFRRSHSIDLSTAHKVPPQGAAGRAGREGVAPTVRASREAGSAYQA